MSGNAIYLATIWAIPVIVAITFHEAAHGFVAYLLGDDTAWWFGRVSFNPAKHVEPSGRSYCRASCCCCALPFSSATPVPVNFQILAVLAALAFHLVGYLPITAARWLADNLRNALILNVILAVFNLFPLHLWMADASLLGFFQKPSPRVLLD